MPDDRDYGATFDHYIHWVDDLDVASQAYDAAGLPVTPALTMEGFRNAAWGMKGERYVELATVDDWEAVQRSKYAGSLAILKPAVDALSGPGPLTFAVDVADVHATAADLRERGYEVDEITVWFEDRGGGFTEAFVRNAPPYVPFFITYNPPRPELARLRDAARAEQGIVVGDQEITAILVGSAAPETDAADLARLLGVPVDGAVVDLPGAQVRFEQSDRTGVFGMTVRRTGRAPGATEIMGMTVRIED